WVTGLVAGGVVFFGGGGVYFFPALTAARESMALAVESAMRTCSRESLIRAVARESAIRTVSRESARFFAAIESNCSWVKVPEPPPQDANIAADAAVTIKRLFFITTELYFLIITV